MTKTLGISRVNGSKDLSVDADQDSIEKLGCRCFGEGHDHKVKS